MTRAESKPSDWFENVAGSAGIQFAYRDGSESGFYQLLESVGGGAALVDYDGDGDVDLFITGGGRLEGPPIQCHGRRSALFRNDGQGGFAEVAEELGLGDDRLYTHGCTAGDFDNDGFADLFVAGYGGCRLYHNQAGKSFVDVTERSGLHCPGWNVTGAWGDVDRDGLLDLYVVTYADWQPDHRRECRNDQGLRDVCGPTLFPGDRDRLFRNLGGGRFENVTERAGLVPRNRGLGVVAADFNGDQWLDFLVVNDVEQNQLYLGGAEFPFREEGVVQGVAYSITGEREGSMGVDAGDFDGDGLIDVWYVNYVNQDNSLLRNTGRGFVPAAPLAGLMAVSRRWVGFGTGLADFNHDGWPDLFVVNGHVAYERRDSPYFQPAQLFANQGGRRYVEITARGGPYFSVLHAGRGAAVGDLDNDGALDLVIVHQNDPVAVLKNRLPCAHWVRVKLVGRESNRDAVGAQVLAPFGERTLHFWIRGGGGYASYFDPRVLIPQPKNGPVDVTVHWPSGLREVFSRLAQRQSHELAEGTGSPCE
jgi:hypothetical protein